MCGRLYWRTVDNTAGYIAVSQNRWLSHSREMEDQSKHGVSRASGNEKVPATEVSNFLPLVGSFKYASDYIIHISHALYIFTQYIFLMAEAKVDVL